MTQSHRPFDSARFAELRRTVGLGLGASLSATEMTESTNDDALAAAREGAAHGTTFVTDSQTRGRGRRGRAWFASPGESLLCSVVLRLPLAPEAAIPLPLAVGLAVRAAVEKALPASRALDARVKWPNDVWIGDKKVAGILVETCLRGKVLDAIVVGFGINVHTREFPEELRDVASSIALAIGDDATGTLSREGLLISVLTELERRLSDFLKQGVRGLLAEFSQFDALRGRSVRVDAVEGRAEGIDQEGRLLIRQADDTRVSVVAGTVELVDGPSRFSA